MVKWCASFSFAAAVAAALRPCARAVSLPRLKRGAAAEPGEVGAFDQTTRSALTPTCSWHHPEGRYHTLIYGQVVGPEGHIYVTCADGLRKFSSQCEEVWHVATLPAELPSVAALADGVVVAAATNGTFFAVDAGTGAVRWSQRVCSKVGQDNGVVGVRDGVVVAASNHNGFANLDVVGLNASTGAHLWTYTPDNPVWNFMPSYLADTVLFQDFTGRGYRIELFNGALRWKAGGLAYTWTDGSATLGPNGLLYTVNNNVSPFHRKTADDDGTLTARRAEDGAFVWRVTTPQPPNNAPAVGLLAPGENLSVVQPMGQQIMQDAQTSVTVYDAATGEERWRFMGPRQLGRFQAGDAEGAQQRMAAGLRSMCLPNPWSAPTIAEDGTVYVGNEEGQFFALAQERAQDGLRATAEVYDTGACFAGSSRPSVTKDLVVTTSCDGLFVFPRPA